MLSDSDLENFTKPWNTLLSEDQQKEVKYEITCAICLDVYQDPTITKCQHTFCKACIDKLYESTAKDSCPLCRANSYPLRSAEPKITAIVKKALGLGSSPTALDALKTPEEKSQYEQCRSKIQEDIMASDSFEGPWSCELPGSLSKSVLFRLRHQLELRGFSLFNIFNSEDKIYCEIIGNETENVAKDEKIITENIDASEKIDDWDPNFTAEKLYNRATTT